MKAAYHLYEVIISNSRVWLKVQSSCSSSEQAAAFFESRFIGTDYFVDGSPDVTPFKLSNHSKYIANWRSIENRLPEGWNDNDFHIEGTPYPWCETLSDDCNCHGTKGRLDTLHCSDFGLHEEAEKLASKSQNIRYLNYIREMEVIIAHRDESRREQRLQKEQRSPPKGTILFSPNLTGQDAANRSVTGPPSTAINRVNGLVAQGFYCSIHGERHGYGGQAIRKTMASLTANWAQILTFNRADRELAISRIGDIAEHCLKVNQSEECAQRFVWGDVDIPDILFKYIPKNRIGRGAPNSLRATQLLALNDDMECNVNTMKSSEQRDALAFLQLVQSKLKEHLDIAVPWEELLTQSISFGGPRLSTFIQNYLNPLVGVVSFSTDILVPTMWAHYARNTGIVVGYDTAALSDLGFELRPVVYSELAPSYEPAKDDVIRLDFVNREDMERDLRAGKSRKGIPILATTKLAEFGTGWKTLSRLLLVKGMSWAYEKEVRLLVDQEHARDTEKKDSNGWPIKVIDPPPEAIREIYRTENTQDEDLKKAVQIARRGNKSGLFVGRVTSHAFRMQKTGGVNY